MSAALAEAAATAVHYRLLAGKDTRAGAESLEEHLARLGRAPRGGPWLVAALHRAGLRGRGGAWFPTARKWEGVAAAASGGRAVVVVNASEGEPLSRKDRVLVGVRPHLVLDGAVLAADSIGATEIIVYLARGPHGAEAAIRRAIAERRRAGLAEPSFRTVRTPHRYISGESSAAVEWLNGAPALPRFTPPHVSAEGVHGWPTLVQNAETLANAALLAREGWAGLTGPPAAAEPDTTLMTVTGNVRQPGVYEVLLGAGAAAVMAAAGGPVSPPGGALLGGYFGSWMGPSDLARLELRDGLGCGILAVLPEAACPIEEAHRVLAYLAAESAGQCGPCVNGLRSIALLMGRLARSEAAAADSERLQRWAGMIRGRGACRMPDGAATNLESVLRAFPDHLRHHLSGRPCPGRRVGGFPRPPARRAALLDLLRLG